MVLVKVYFILFSEKKNQKPLAVDVLLKMGTAGAIDTQAFTESAY